MPGRLRRKGETKGVRVSTSPHRMPEVQGEWCRRGAGAADRAGLESVPAAKAPCDVQNGFSPPCRHLRQKRGHRRHRRCRRKGARIDVMGVTKGVRFPFLE